MAEQGGDLTSRMIGAALFKVDTYEEVEHDETATDPSSMTATHAAYTTPLFQAPTAMHRDARTTTVAA